MPLVLFYGVLFCSGQVWAVKLKPQLYISHFALLSLSNQDFLLSPSLTHSLTMPPLPLCRPFLSSSIFVLWNYGIINKGQRACERTSSLVLCCVVLCCVLLWEDPDPGFKYYYTFPLTSPTLPIFSTSFSFPTSKPSLF